MTKLSWWSLVAECLLISLRSLSLLMPVSHYTGSPQDLPSLSSYSRGDPQGILRGSSLVWHRHKSPTLFFPLHTISHSSSCLVHFANCPAHTHTHTCWSSYPGGAEHAREARLLLHVWPSASRCPRIGWMDVWNRDFRLRFEFFGWQKHQQKYVKCKMKVINIQETNQITP